MHIRSKTTQIENNSLSCLPKAEKTIDYQRQKNVDKDLQEITFL
ncbi:hypothetical protein HMPREF1348_02470 [Enterococcus faecium 505]|uniref:Uncharacterized protein n=1 Tax=Enterococcus faecium 505 TaxID=1134806 RepID=J7CST5_ENTFC|nr:hypothetical protein HMPREF1348_02470 [Enterococcus faecium 505]